MLPKVTLFTYSAIKTAHVGQNLILMRLGAASKVSYLKLVIAVSEVPYGVRYLGTLGTSK